MASQSLQGLSRSIRSLRALVSSSKDPLTQCLNPRLSRSMATEASLPGGSTPDYTSELIQNAVDGSVETSVSSSVLTTIYKFPTMEPLRFESYDSKHLHLPLRRDILHRAVIFEGDFTRQGTASSKTRFEVHGGHRKIRPQKGGGQARLGTRQSPMLKGGGKSFGPHPRDFSTGLPKKMYDLAWRTALSWRYRRGELIICEDGMDIEYPKTRFVKSIFDHNHWGREGGRTLIITESPRTHLFGALRPVGDYGRAQVVEDVDVKDLLELGRIVIEKSALDTIIREHQSDLMTKVRSAV